MTASILNTPSVSSGISQSAGQLVSPQLGPPSYYGSVPTSVQFSSQSVLGPSPSQPSGETSQSQYFPSQFIPTPFRGFNRGRGRGPRPPCDICGRSNHTTNYCYYKSSFPQMFQQSVQPVPQFVQGAQWRSSNQFQPWSIPPSSWSNTGVPLYQSQIPSSRPFTQQPMYHYQPPQAPLAVYPSPPTQAHFAGYTEGFSAGPMSSVPGMIPGGAFSNAPSFSGFTGGSFNAFSSVTSPATHPWFFDSGATNHITHNLQNLANPQPATAHDGIMVGNGSQLQASHTGKGQDYTQNLVQGAMSQGSVSHSDLL
ncbi:hypothetical protein RHGRI_003902 [Rhododendron griersonianum]|uniref:Retrovirus-related Pol polyprotein from transposon TNT 1-94-like beta-barrel domain-containing protein n=1 Tax=Rhododendron griersonianum TaxID=479676 RepID=A0AAV6L7U8_9ERIC|nr:hypothetical protein RHGRI_003902 [Rhododendron griersonianum]